MVDNVNNVKLTDFMAVSLPRIARKKKLIITALYIIEIIYK